MPDYADHSQEAINAAEEELARSKIATAEERARLQRDLAAKWRARVKMPNTAGDTATNKSPAQLAAEEAGIEEYSREAFTQMERFGAPLGLPMDPSARQRSAAMERLREHAAETLPKAHNPLTSAIREKAAAEFRRELDATSSALDVREMRDRMTEIVRADIQAVVAAEIREAIEAPTRETAYREALADEISRLESEYQLAKAAGDGALQQTLMRQKEVAVRLDRQRRAREQAKAKMGDAV
jgi:hypothetical protein